MLKNIGRNNKNEIVLSESEISNFHAQLISDDDNNIFINDLNSENGTFVNGNSISQSTQLNKGDMVKLSGVPFQWETHVTYSTSSAGAGHNQVPPSNVFNKEDEDLNDFLVEAMEEPIPEKKIKKETTMNVNVNTNDSSNNAKCQKCGSTSIHAAKNGFSGGKACCGALLVGPLGLLCGTNKRNKVIVTCLNCKHKW
jgi:pSer/pThr/pTyr-binding forkhead associated (FHA) protein